MTKKLWSRNLMEKLRSYRTTTSISKSLMTVFWTSTKQCRMTTFWYQKKRRTTRRMRNRKLSKMTWRSYLQSRCASYTFKFDRKIRLFLQWRRQYLPRLMLLKLAKIQARVLIQASALTPMALKQSRKYYLRKYLSLLNKIKNLVLFQGSR